MSGYAICPMTGPSTNRPLVSLIVPIWNEEAALPSFLAQFAHLDTGQSRSVVERILPAGRQGPLSAQRSVPEQSRRQRENLWTLSRNENYELIFADGGSTDKSVALLASYPWVRVISSQQGRAHQMNKAAAVAQGDWLFFVHVDSQLPNSWWQAVEELFGSPYQAACFRLQFDVSHPLLRLAAYGSRWRSLLFRGGDQGLLITKKAFMNLGGYDLRFTVCEDLDIFRRIQKKFDWKQLSQPITTSARRFQKNGVITTLFHFRILHFLHYYNSSPDLLYKYYKRWIRS